MNSDSPAYPLSLLFDLAATLAVPRISRYVPRLMWPDVKAAEFRDLSKLVGAPRPQECDQERWPFNAGADKVVTVVQAIASIRRPAEARELVLCYSTEYYLELLFQRFCAWAVYGSAAKEDREGNHTHFHYRNAYANARAVLAMPLLVDLTRPIEAVVGQGNFGYKPSKDSAWIYPHLSHYLSAFYYPWVPNLELPDASRDCAAERALRRTTAVCGELYPLLLRGEFLRPEQRAKRPETGFRLLDQLPSLFHSDKRAPVSPFVYRAVMGTQLAPYLRRDEAWEFDAEAVGRELHADNFLKRLLDEYAGPDDDAPCAGLSQMLLQTCRKSIEDALGRELGAPAAGVLDLTAGRVKEFLRWRFLEERLRLINDRIFLTRRFYDPPLTRTRFSSKFENLGLFAVEVPEIQFNLDVESLNEPDRCGGRKDGAATRREEQREEWIKEAHRLYRESKRTFWAQGRFPYHALFETYVTRADPCAQQFDAFWMALLISHIVPSVNYDKDRSSRSRGLFVERVREMCAQEWKRSPSEIMPFLPLTHILREKRRNGGGADAAEDLVRWEWLAGKLAKLLRQEFGHDDWERVTLEDVLGGILNESRRAGWPDPLEELGEPDASAQADRARRRRFEKAQQEAFETEERGKLFFSFEDFFGINTTIFRALADRDQARNFVTIRLIATERASTRTGASLDNQDHADFVGTYVVWQRGADGRLASDGGGRYVPRHDAWKDAPPDDVGARAQGWLAELHNQKLLIKNLGVSLLNHERIKEQERLNALVRKETARSTIAGIMARNMSHNIGSHVLASSELLTRMHREEVQKLHSFLQQRMDFIAQVVTYTPSWGEPTFFFKDLLKGFFEQLLLLRNLIKDQGYEKITFTVKAGAGGNEYIFGEQTDEKCGREKCNKLITAEADDDRCDCREGGVEPEQQVVGGWTLRAIRTPEGERELKKLPDAERAAAAELPDFLVAVPGGAIGAHAFYVILENILRNSAKYGEQQPKEVGLDLHIEVTEEDEIYRVLLWDNTGTRGQHQRAARDRCDCRVCVLQRNLREELIDPHTGEVNERSRGIHEMRQCSEILINPDLDRFGEAPDGDKRHAIWAREKRVQLNGAGAEYLSYSFVLQKPRLVGIVDAAGAAAGMMEAKRAGIFHYASVEELSKYPHQIGIIFMRGGSAPGLKDYIEKHHYLLPYRLLLVDEEGGAWPELPRRRFIKCERIEFPRENGYEAWQGFVLQAYELWLRKFRAKGDNRKWKLLISFDREEGHAAFGRWGKALAGFRSEVADVYLIRSHRKLGCQSVEYPPSGADKAELQRLIAGDEGSWIVFDNHRAGINSLVASDKTAAPGRAGKNVLRAYNDFGSENIKLYQTLESPPPAGFSFNFFVLGLLESALTTVVIVDERVAEASYDEQQGFRKKPLLRDLRWSRCYPIYSVWAKRRGDRGSLARKFISETIEQRSRHFEKEDMDPVHGSEGLYLEESGACVRVQIPSELGSDVELLPFDVDALIIHQGVIDVLDRNGQWQGDKDNDRHLNILHQISPSVIITSGRGRTIRHLNNKEIPFVEFSILKDSTYAGLSKYHLVRSILSVAGERQKG
jgi:hypothetical protein